MARITGLEFLSDRTNSEITEPRFRVPLNVLVHITHGLLGSIEVEGLDQAADTIGRSETDSVIFAASHTMRGDMPSVAAMASRVSNIMLTERESNDEGLRWSVTGKENYFLIPTTKNEDGTISNHQFNPETFRPLADSVLSGRSPVVAAYSPANDTVGMIRRGIKADGLVC